MIPRLRGASLCLFVFLLAAVPAAVAQDHIILGSVTASGSTADVPVSIRDMAGTPLGVDRPAGSRIQALSIRVTYAPAAAVQSVTFSRAGITRTLTPVFETAPKGNGSASLVVSFDEASNPIPFSLNGTNLVAHLVFTLSNAAAPSTSIALELDPALTQLTDSGGSAATKETESNGHLRLVDGSIDIPARSISLSPGSRTIAQGGSAAFEARLSTAASVATTVQLLSSNPSAASVPASVIIAAGELHETFNATAPPTATGETTITASIDGSSDTALVTVTIADTPAPCDAPGVPQPSTPSLAEAGVSYDVTWGATVNTTGYVLEESDDEGFSDTRVRTLTGTTASFTHSDAGVRYYYRLRARNLGPSCDRFSAYSPVVSLLVTGNSVPATHVLTVAGSLQGNFGSFFKTALQLYNPHETGLSGRLIFHPAGASGSDADPSLPFSIAPRQTLAFDDVLPAMGIASGLGSIDLVTDPGSPTPAALARVFNDAGTAGTTGLGQELRSPGDSLQSGDRGVLFAPRDLTRFRLNIGVRTLAAGAAMIITVRDADGIVVRTTSRSYTPTFFTQISSAAFLDGYTLSGGETITVELTSGSAFLYGALTDNVTNDPSVQFAERVN